MVFRRIFIELGGRPLEWKKKKKKEKKEKEKVKNHEKFLQKRSGERIAFLTKKKISM